MVDRAADPRSTPSIPPAAAGRCRSPRAEAAAAPTRSPAASRRRGLWLALVVASHGAAQTASQDPVEQDPPVRLSKWPKANDRQRQRAIGLLGQFKKDGAELHRHAHDQLMTMGELAVPMLFLKVKDREPNENEPIFALLDAILQPPHATLMARQAVRKKIELRRYLVRRLCQFHAPDMKPVLARMTRDEDDDIAFYAWLGLLGLGQLDALEPVLERTRRDWNEQRQLLASVLIEARSDAAGRAVSARIAQAPAVVQTAGLRLMRYLATRPQQDIVRPYLMAEDHGVKKAAVNAMRVLAGMPPIEKLSVFQTIEMAKEWQTR